MRIELTDREALRLRSLIREFQDETQVHRLSTPKRHMGFHYMLDDISVDLASIANKLANKGD